jgi:hypothetical protein
MEQLALDEGWDEAWWSPEWFPFASDGAGQLLVVDERGRVLEFLHDDDARPVLAASLEAYLVAVLESLERGRLVVDPDYGLVEPGFRERLAARAAERAPPPRPRWELAVVMGATLLLIGAFIAWVELNR